MRSWTVGVLVLLDPTATIVWLASMVDLGATCDPIETLGQATFFSLSLGLLPG